ncbi:hypothetical protein [Sandaracinus amylolyticus]|uniref:hypothetical protein n=1 Tax=Sandaracinus amylolyticus TaxID=927083 RepID=UPI001F177B9A|nr:hypothetical protein [Sandaracinus amylolyticus]
MIRALHLDRHCLEIVRQEGGVVKDVTELGIVDDVVGPTVNRQVIARGRWRRSETALL